MYSHSKRAYAIPAGETSTVVIVFSMLYTVVSGSPASKRHPMWVPFCCIPFSRPALFPCRRNPRSHTYVPRPTRFLTEPPLSALRRCHPHGQQRPILVDTLA